MSVQAGDVLCRSSFQSCRVVSFTPGSFQQPRGEFSLCGVSYGAVPGCCVRGTVCEPWVSLLGEYFGCSQRGEYTDGQGASCLWPNALQGGCMDNNKQWIRGVRRCFLVFGGISQGVQEPDCHALEEPGSLLAMEGVSEAAK